MSRISEYQNKWNSNVFLNDFDERDEDAGINIKLKDIYVPPHYIWKNNNYILNDIKDLLSDYIYNNFNNRMLLIFGRPGIGKTSLITWITDTFINIKDNIIVYNFASDLKNIEWMNTSEKYDIVEEFLEELKFSYDDIKGKILIIDGFDEINVGNRTRILNQFFRKLIKNDSLNNFSLIITCRENYIQRLNEIECDYITLQPWDTKQILSFCALYQKTNYNSLSDDALQNILDNKEILGIPLILYMTLALNVPIGEKDSIMEIYDNIFSLEGGIYDHSIKKIGYANSHRIDEVKEQVYLISGKIAFWIFENNFEGEYIPQKEFEKICNSVIQEEFSESDNQIKTLLIGNYLKLFKYCDVSETHLYFCQRSIYEFFVSEYIFMSINEVVNISTENLASIFGNVFKADSLSREIFAFLKNKVKKSRLNSLFGTVNSTFHLMLHNGMTYYTMQCYKNIIECEMNVFINMLEFIHLWDKKCYRFDDSISSYLKYNVKKRLNLRRTDLRGMDLYMANLEDADLGDADLRGISFKMANLSGSDLSGANLMRADLALANLMQANLKSANLKSANLRRTNLLGAYLKDTIFDSADLSNAIFDRNRITD